MKVADPAIGIAEAEGINNVLERGAFSQGKYVEMFEADLANYLGVHKDHVVCVSNGTAALHLAMILEANVLKDIVTLPSMTFIATGNVVKYVGKKTKFVDVYGDTWMPHEAPDIGVDLFGDPLTRHPLIEDAAGALGSEIHGKKCGALGHIGCLSFFENKIITSGGEGGALICEDKGDAEIGRLLRQQGKTFEMDHHGRMGYNYRMTELQAAIGIAQLKKIESFMSLKRNIRAYYEERLSEHVDFQSSYGKSNCWMIGSIIKKNFDKVRKQLWMEGIPFRRFYPPLHHHPWFDYMFNDDMSTTNALWDHGLILPSSISLTDDYLDKICKVILNAIK